MTAPQRVDPARIRSHVRARTVAKVATGVIWVGLVAVAAAILAGHGWAPAWMRNFGGMGVSVAVAGFVGSILARHHADRYRQPADDGEGER